MAYDGDVAVGGPAQQREAGGLTIGKIAVGDFNNNAYLLTDQESGRRVLVDAAAEADTLLRWLGDDPLEQIVTTHRHGDHWQALAAVASATGAQKLAGENDAAGIDVATDTTLADGETLSLGGSDFRIIELVGHTPGAIALLYTGDPERPHLFTGDCLFPGGVGNTEKDPERFARLLHDVETKLFEPLPDSTWVYPGHGADTTLGAERPSLGEWRSRGW